MKERNDPAGARTAPAEKGRRARCIMVQGTMSGAGKSLLCAALCRIFRQDGLRCAPFKSQNMALNSAVTRDGLEMGRAQAVQAAAAGVEPDVRMNPVLLKPSSDVGSQVIVMGQVRGQMPAREYFRYKKQLLPEILAAYESLAAEYDVIVIEGAGSPAEINLKADDIVNMGLAKRVDAPVLLAGDIDRGGVFAQLYGTVALLEPEERARIKGLVINKFRGDGEILRPGLAPLEQKTGIPVVGVVPYVRVEIDDEDSLAPGLDQTRVHKPLDVAVIRLPRISNFTDFAPLEQHPLVGVRYVTGAQALGTPDAVILPGTKSTLSDLLWLRQSGMEAALLKLAAAGTPVLGICGGYQMLGRTIADPDGAEGEAGAVLRGLGLLPADTLFRPEKTRTRVKGRALAGPFAGGCAGRLRDPHGPDRDGRRGTLLPPGRWPGRRLRGGQRVRHLPARPVRHRRGHRPAGRRPVPAQGDPPGGAGGRPPVPRRFSGAGVRPSGRRGAGRAGYGSHLPHDGGLRWSLDWYISTGARAKARPRPPWAWRCGRWARGPGW